MQRILWIALLAGIAWSLSACAVPPPSRVGAATVSDIRVPVIPPQGLLFTKVTAPVATMPGTGPFGPKRGEVTSHQLAVPPLPIPGLWRGLPLIAWGDVSEKAAANAGGITNVNHVEYENMIILMLYRRFKLIAYGD